MNLDLAMVCPSKGRPLSVGRMGEAWERTFGDVGADLFWIIDKDDPTYDAYEVEIAKFPWMHAASIDRWMPLVPKLNWAARVLAADYESVGFLGDDHIPRTSAWTAHIVTEMSDGPAKIVYGRDGFQDQRLPTWWAMSSEIVRTLGNMVPSDVQHLYCDNVVMELGKRSKRLVYLDSVLIEHMHPAAGKAEWDAGHIRVNRGEQYERDRRAFLAYTQTGLNRDARLITEIRGV